MKQVILQLFRIQCWCVLVFISLGTLSFLATGDIMAGICFLLVTIVVVWRLIPFLFRGINPVMGLNMKTIFTYIRWNFGFMFAAIGIEGFMKATKQHERPVFSLVYLLMGLILLSPLDTFIFIRYRSIIPALSVRPKDSTVAILSGLWWFIGITIYCVSTTFLQENRDLMAVVFFAIGLLMIFINPVAALLKNRKPSPAYTSYPWKAGKDMLEKTSTIMPGPAAATAKTVTGVTVKPVTPVTPVTTVKPAATVSKPNSSTEKENAFLQLIQKGESSVVEFKSTLRVDVRTGKPEKFIQHSVIKTLAAFLNSQGGTLLIGVDDNKNVIGLENDFSSFSKPDKLDEFQKFLDNLLGNSIGNRFHRYLEVDFPGIGEKVICVIRIKTKSGEPVYITNDGGQEVFYIRRLASTIDLKPSEAFKYMQEHW